MLAGGGTADAAVPNTLAGQTVTLNPVGQVTSLRGVTLAYSPQGQLRTMQRTVGSETETEDAFHDGAGRTVARFRQRPSVGFETQEFYLHEGANIVAVYSGTHASPPLAETWLFEGVDQPLRINVRGSPNLVYYYELDLAGNVRRLVKSGGVDGGGYRYTAFGAQMPADATTPAPAIDQPLRWKGRWHSDFVPGAGIYDVRARAWSPEMGAFTSIDEYAFHDARSTLWGWGHESPLRFGDPSGRDATLGGHPKAAKGGRLKTGQ